MITAISVSKSMKSFILFCKHFVRNRSDNMLAKWKNPKLIFKIIFNFMFFFSQHFLFYVFNLSRWQPYIRLSFWSPFSIFLSVSLFESSEAGRLAHLPGVWTPLTSCGIWRKWTDFCPPQVPECPPGPRKHFHASVSLGGHAGVLRCSSARHCSLFS